MEDLPRLRNVWIVRNKNGRTRGPWTPKSFYARELLDADLTIAGIWVGEPDFHCLCYIHVELAVQKCTPLLRSVTPHFLSVIFHF